VSGARFRSAAFRLVDIRQTFIFETKEPRQTCRASCEAGGPRAVSGVRHGRKEVAWRDYQRSTCFSSRLGVHFVYWPRVSTRDGGAASDAQFCSRRARTASVSVAVCSPLPPIQRRSGPERGQAISLMTTEITLFWFLDQCKSRFEKTSINSFC